MPPWYSSWGSNNGGKDVLGGKSQFYCHCLVFLLWILPSPITPHLPAPQVIPCFLAHLQRPWVLLASNSVVLFSMQIHENEVRKPQGYSQCPWSDLQGEIFHSPLSPQFPGLGEQLRSVSISALITLHRNCFSHINQWSTSWHKQCHPYSCVSHCV